MVEVKNIKKKISLSYPKYPNDGLYDGGSHPIEPQKIYRLLIDGFCTPYFLLEYQDILADPNRIAQFYTLLSKRGDSFYKVSLQKPDSFRIQLKAGRISLEESSLDQLEDVSSIDSDAPQKDFETLFKRPYFEPLTLYFDQNLNYYIKVNISRFKSKYQKISIQEYNELRYIKRVITDERFVTLEEQDILPESTPPITVFSDGSIVKSATERIDLFVDSKGQIYKDLDSSTKVELSALNPLDENTIKELLQIHLLISWYNILDDGSIASFQPKEIVDILSVYRDTKKKEPQTLTLFIDNNHKVYLQVPFIQDKVDISMLKDDLSLADLASYLKYGKNISWVQIGIDGSLSSALEKDIYAALAPLREFSIITWDKTEDGLYNYEIAYFSMENNHSFNFQPK